MSPRCGELPRLLRKAVKPHDGAEIHVVLGNLSTHTTADPHVHFHFTPVGSWWINQIETWFGIITRQSIRRGTFTSVTEPLPTCWTARSGRVRRGVTSNG